MALVSHAEVYRIEPQLAYPARVSRAIANSV